MRLGMQQETFDRERHIEATPTQRQHAEIASKDRSLFSKENHGEPPVAATPRAGKLQGEGVVRASRTPVAPAGNPKPPGRSPEGREPPRSGQELSRPGEPLRSNEATRPSELPRANEAPHPNEPARANGVEKTPPSRVEERGPAEEPRRVPQEAPRGETPRSEPRPEARPEPPKAEEHAPSPSPRVEERGPEPPAAREAPRTAPAPHPPAPAAHPPTREEEKR